MFKRYYRENFSMCRNECAKEVLVYSDKSKVTIYIGAYAHQKNYKQKINDDIQILKILENNNYLWDLIISLNNDEDDYISYNMKTLKMIDLKYVKKFENDFFLNQLETLMKKFISINLFHLDISFRNLGYDENNNLDFIDYESFTLFNSIDLFKESLTYMLTYNDEFNKKLSDLELKLSSEYQK